HGTGKDQGAELDDEIALFGDRHEIGRIEYAAGRVVPARQGLEARQRLRRQIVDRLVDDPELARLGGTPQVVLERDATLLLGAPGGVVDLYAIGPAPLGAIHGDLRLAQQRSRLFVGPVVEGNADRGREHDLAASDADRRTQRAAHLLGQHGELA